MRVPLDNILLGEGRGFEIAQGRLGPGRVHHCMRLIGLGSRTLNLMVLRASARSAFGKQLSRNECVLRDIAEARLKVYYNQCVRDDAVLLVHAAAVGRDASAHVAHGLDDGSIRQQGACSLAVMFTLTHALRRLGT